MTDTLFSVQATVVLAELEQIHGQVRRVHDDIPQAEELLSLCSTGTRVYMCMNCDNLFTIEPDGEARVWWWDQDGPHGSGREEFADE